MVGTNAGPFVVAEITIAGTPEGVVDDGALISNSLANTPGLSNAIVLSPYISNVIDK